MTLTLTPAPAPTPTLPRRETEDVRLDMSLVRRREWGAPDASVMEDVTDEWAMHA